MAKSEFWANGYDAGYDGAPAHDHDYAPGTAAWNDWYAGYEDGATDSWNEGQEDDYDANDDGDDDGQPDFGFEHDSAMTSIGWGTDEDYGFYGGDDY